MQKTRILNQTFDDKSTLKPPDRPPIVRKPTTGEPPWRRDSKRKDRPMRPTQDSRIAIQTLLTCATRPNDFVLTRDIAAASNTTKGYAAKVVARLVRHGLLRSHRGRHGGVQLAVCPYDVGVGTVLRLMQPTLESGPIRGQQAALFAQSAVDAVLRSAADAFLATLDNVTLADLVTGAGAERLACRDCELKTTGGRSRAWSVSDGSSKRSMQKMECARERLMQHACG